MSGKSVMINGCRDKMSLAGRWERTLKMFLFVIIVPEHGGKSLRLLLLYYFLRGKTGINPKGVIELGLDSVKSVKLIAQRLIRATLIQPCRAC